MEVRRSSFIVICFFFLSITKLHNCWSFQDAVQVPDFLSIDVIIDPARDNYCTLLDKAITGTIPIDCITFESDVYIQENEFLYLIGLRRGMHADVSDFKKALFYLIKKNMFHQIQLRIHPSEQGYAVHFVLQGFWTFHKLVCKGLIIGKDIFRHHYLMEPGDQFEEEKHRHSLIKINNAFRKDGYFDANVKDALKYDLRTKTVTATIVLERGERFVIDDVLMQIDSHDSLRDNELRRLAIKLDKLLACKLKKGCYAKKTIERETKSVKHYLSRKGFLPAIIQLEEKINYTTKWVKLIFSIDIQQQKEFFFFGNHFFSRDQLLECLLPFGQSAWLLPLSMLAEELIQAYHKKGFWHVTIDYREEPHRIFFLVKEGKRIAIRDVIIRNATILDNVLLVKRYFSPLLKHRYFDENLVKQSLDDLLSFYLKEGFWDAKIIHQSFELLDEDKACRFIITVDEGQQSYLSNVTVEGFKALEKQLPFAHTKKAKRGIPFDFYILEKQKQWLSQYFRDSGYDFVSINPVLQRDKNNVAVTWKIKKNDVKIDCGKVVVIGSNTFPIEHILRELPCNEGAWKPDITQQLLTKLKDLDLFEVVHVYPDTQLYGCEQPLILKLQKDDRFEIRMRAGLGLQQITKPINIYGLTYRVGGAFIWRNPSNSGDQLRFDVDADRLHRDVVLQYRRPWLGNYPIKTVVQGYSILHCQPRFLTCQRSLYDVAQQGGLIGLTRRYWYSDSGCNIGFEWMRLRIVKEFSSIANNIARAFDFDPMLLNKQIPYFFIEPTVLVDLTDNKLSPTRGIFTLVSCKSMIPLCNKSMAENGFFVRLLAEQSFFIPLRPFVLAVRLRVGHIFRQSFRKIMLTERFYLGGANSLRSYEADFTPPVGSFLDCSHVRQFVPQGGKSMINLNIEWRFPLYAGVWGVVFQDVGALRGDSLSSVKDYGLLTATGFGLRYNTPIGPLRFDIGWKGKNAIPFNRSYAWFLTFGHLF